MSFQIEKAKEIGFCYGVARAVEILEKAVKDRGKIETLGAVVHNEQVLRKLGKQGISVIKSIEQISGEVVAISSHGISPDVEAKLHKRGLKILDTTCPFVRRSQVAARRLSESGFYVIIYGDARHTEVKGILGWANNHGVATLNAKDLKIDLLPRRLGILSQTTQIPADFIAFASDVVRLALNRDAEIRIIDTICHDIRRRQTISSELAKTVDLLFVVGGQASANTGRLSDLCSKITEVQQVETAGEIDFLKLKGKKRLGVTSGASTSEEAIDEVIAKLESLADV